MTDHVTNEPTVASAVSEAFLHAEVAVARSTPPAASGPPPLPAPDETLPADARTVSLPPPPTDTPEPTTAALATAAPRSRLRYVVAGLFILNALLVGGAVRVYLEVKRARSPVAAISAAVTDLQSDQARVQMRLEESRTALDETRIRLEETRARLDEQAHALAVTTQHQKNAEREAHEHEERAERELAALSARVRRTEGRTFKLDEALKLIDMAQGRPPPPVASATGSTDAHPATIVNP